MTVPDFFSTFFFCSLPFTLGVHGHMLSTGMTSTTHVTPVWQKEQTPFCISAAVWPFSLSGNLSSLTALSPLLLTKLVKLVGLFYGIFFSQQCFFPLPVSHQATPYLWCLKLIFSEDFLPGGRLNIVVKAWLHPGKVLFWGIAILGTQCRGEKYEC